MAVDNRLGGATVARLTPVQKVACSNHVRVTNFYPWNVMGILNPSKVWAPKIWALLHPKEVSITFSCTLRKVLPDRESNPGLPRDRRGYSPLYYRGLNAASISHHVDRSIKIKRGLLTAWKCGGVRRRRAVKAFITGLLHNLETTSKMRWLRNLSK